MDEMTAGRVYTVQEVAEILRTSEKEVHRMCREGRIEWLALSPRHRRFTQAQVDAFIRRCSIVAATRSPERVDCDSVPIIHSVLKGGEETETTGKETAKALREEMKSWLS
jgi:excisionase family DNA binding protein